MRKYQSLAIFSLLILLVFACKKEMVNPYDRECPPELWTPTILTAESKSEGILLAWELEEDHFDGYWIEVSTDSIHWDTIHVDIIVPSQKTYTDTTHYSGVTIRYRISGKADLYRSNYCYSNEITFPFEPLIVRTYAADLTEKDVAVLKGEVISAGGYTVVERGFYWSMTNSKPDEKDNLEIVDGTTGNIFSFTLENLQPATTYYFVAFATNGAGTSIGEVKSFTTDKEIVLPTVITLEATEVTVISAIINGEVTSDGGEATSKRGFYWSLTNQAPNETDNVEIDNGSDNIFSFNLENLQPTTTYYFVAFASNSEGTSTGEVKSFTTGIEIVMPTVITLEATEVTETSAMLNGEVTSDGGAAISERGFYWSLTNNTPNETDNAEKVGGADNVFSFNLENLQPSTTYYFVAFASNSEGTSTGEVKSFTTGIEIVLPMVVTLEATEVTETSAMLNCEVTSDGGAIVTERGFCFNTSGTPDVTDNKINVGGGTGSFSTSIANLEAGITYYVRAFAINSIGVVYGNEISFQTLEAPCTLETFVDPRDGNNYTIVGIGDQTWMAENLAYLPSVNPSSEVSSAESYYYVYGYQGITVGQAKATANYKMYGVLYNWQAATDACPSGWHLPADAEWKQLEMYLGMSQSDADDTGFRGTDEGAKLKVNSGWQSNGDGTNEFCFSALPAGDLNVNGTFGGIVRFGDWWSGSEQNSTQAMHRGLDYDLSGISRNNYAKEQGFSVRCIRDK